MTKCSTTSAGLASGRRPRADDRRRLLALRLAVSAVAVLLCYCLSWDGLRFLTSELNLRLDQLVGLSMQRLSHDTILWNGTAYRYVTACTFVDVWCGALPLVWGLGRGLAANLIRSLLLGVVLLGLNVFRLSLSDLLFDWGVPWLWAHGVVAGLSYYAVWEWVRQNCPEMSLWRDSPRPCRGAPSFNRIPGVAA